MHLSMTIDAIRERINSNLHFLGTVVTNAHQRRNHYQTDGRGSLDYSARCWAQFAAIHGFCMRPRGELSTSCDILQGDGRLRRRARTAQGSLAVTKSARGIGNVLDGILSTGFRHPTDTTLAASEPAQPPAAIAQAAHDFTIPQQTGSRRGRPLGKNKTMAQPKEKVTVWLSSPLVAVYRDWSREAPQSIQPLSRESPCRLSRPPTNFKNRPR